MTQRRAILQGSQFEQQMGYARAVHVEPWVFVSGTTGYDYASGTISSDLAEQAEQALRNISWALEQADASLEDVVRVTYMLRDMSTFEQAFPVLRKYFGEVLPAATAIECAMAAPEMLMEIEVTALKTA